MSLPRGEERPLRYGLIYGDPLASSEKVITSPKEVRHGPPHGTELFLGEEKMMICPCSSPHCQDEARVYVEGTFEGAKGTGFFCFYHFRALQLTPQDCFTVRGVGEIKSPTNLTAAFFELTDRINSLAAIQIETGKENVEVKEKLARLEEEIRAWVQAEKD